LVKKGGELTEGIKEVTKEVVRDVEGFRDKVGEIGDVGRMCRRRNAGGGMPGNIAATENIFSSSKKKHLGENDDVPELKKSRNSKSKLARRRRAVSGEEEEVSRKKKKSKKKSKKKKKEKKEKNVRIMVTSPREEHATHSYSSSTGHHFSSSGQQQQEPSSSSGSRFAGLQGTNANSGDTFPTLPFPSSSTSSVDSLNPTTLNPNLSPNLSPNQQPAHNNPNLNPNQRPPPRMLMSGGGKRGDVFSKHAYKRSSTFFFDEQVELEESEALAAKSSREKRREHQQRVIEEANRSWGTPRDEEQLTNSVRSFGTPRDGGGVDSASFGTASGYGTPDGYGTPTGGGGGVDSARGNTVQQQQQLGLVLQGNTVQQQQQQLHLDAFGNQFEARNLQNRDHPQNAEVAGQASQTAAAPNRTGVRRFLPRFGSRSRSLSNTGADGGVRRSRFAALKNRIMGRRSRSAQPGGGPSNTGTATTTSGQQLQVVGEGGEGELEAVAEPEAEMVALEDEELIFMDFDDHLASGKEEVGGKKGRTKEEWRKERKKEKKERKKEKKEKKASSSRDGDNRKGGGKEGGRREIGSSRNGRSAEPISTGATLASALDEARQFSPGAAVGFVAVDIASRDGPPTAAVLNVAENVENADATAAVNDADATAPSANVYGSKRPSACSSDERPGALPAVTPTNENLTQTLNLTPTNQIIGGGGGGGPGGGPGGGRSGGMRPGDSLNNSSQKKIVSEDIRRAIAFQQEMKQIEDTYQHLLKLRRFEDT